jgi:hypothetical protein
MRQYVEQMEMSKTRLSSIAIITFMATSIILGFYKIPFSSAFAPTASANPRLIYWPPIERWGQGYLIGNQWVNAKSMVWSPSGKYLLIYGEVHAMSINMEGSWMLIVDMDSGELAYNFSCQSINFWGPERFVQFAFSSDETKIFYVKSNFTSYVPQLFSVNLDGSGSTFITDVNSTSESTVRGPVSIDMTSEGILVYAACESVYNVTSGQYNYTSYIWKYNLTTGEKSLILQLEGIDQIITSLKVSPSGDKIAFTVGSDVWIADINGAEPPTSITSASDGKIAAWVDWISNGTTLTYSEINGTINEFGYFSGGWDAWSGNMTAVNLDGSNKHNILSEGYGLVWSPTGSLAAYVRVPRMSYNEGYPYLIDFNMPITPNPDSDGDGLPDSSEIQNFLNPLDPTDIYEDYDNDGLTNLEEIDWGTYLGNPDIDGDGLSDGVEVKVFKTNPTKADTDGDGISDGLEAAATGLSAFVSVLPEGWIRMTLQWSNKTMYVSTNSSVLGVVFNSTSMALSISVGGPDGTTGIANITIPMEMINSLSAVQVTLDNQPINFQINQVGSNAQIYVEYHHSFHELTAHLQGGSAGIGGGDLTSIMGYWWLILSVAIVAVASVIALIIVKRG